MTTRRKKGRFPKVRTGCTTCKARRVKCDEVKPQCRSCTKVGRVCGGYVVPKTLDLDVFVGDERRSYQYYLEQVASRIAGLYGVAFWMNLLPQFSYVQPAVRHAVVSVGALYEALQYETFQGFVVAKRARAKQLRLLSLDQVNKALAMLTTNMLELPIETVLSTCILFVAIYNLLGDWNAVFKHLKSGCEIAIQWSNRANRSISSSTERSVVEFLVRIGSQYGLPDRIQKEPSVVTLQLPSAVTLPAFEVPASFPDLAAAYTSINLLMRYSEQAYGSQSPGEHHSATTHVDLIPRLMSLLQRWSCVLGTLVATLPKGFKPRLQQAVAQLVLQFLTTKLFILTTPFDNEMIFDRHLKDFVAIVEWARRYVAAQKTFERMHDVLGHDWHLNIPLRATAAHCRHPKVRREAIRLLRASIRPGEICNSQYTSDWMERLMKLEEAGLTEETVQKGIPEERRLRFVRLRMYSRHCGLDGQAVPSTPSQASSLDPESSTHIITFSMWPHADNEYCLRHEVLRYMCPTTRIMRELQIVPPNMEEPHVDRLVRHRLPCGCTTDLFSVVGPGMQLFDDP